MIYARYSSDNQREESIEGQIRECTAYAEKNGITIVKHYIDRAISAKTDNRPEFQQMIKDSDKKLFDIVLVWKLDRFARNRYDSAHYEYQLERNHVKLVSATEPISDSPAGIMVKSMLTGMAEYYSAELSEKVVRGMTENVLKGKYNGGTIPIGFKVDEEKFFQIDPLKAPFVVEAFQRYNDGATMKELMNWLNDSGVTTNRNQKFTYNSVQTLLTNKRYIGENHFKDIVMPDSIPAIVDKDLFEEVQLKIKKNSRAPARHKAEDDYLLTTKLFCGMCGAMMFGECGTGRNKVVHHYYKCATAKRFKTCKKKIVRKEWLEDLVIAETMKLIQDDAVIDAIVAEVMELQDQENTTLPLLEKQMRSPQTTGKWEKGLSSIAKGKMTEERFMASIRRYVQFLIQDAASGRRADVIFPEEQVRGKRRKTNAFGKCPFCGRDILENSKSFYCAGWKSGCKFSLWKDSLKPYGLELDGGMVKLLLKKNKSERVAVTLPQTGEKGTAVLILNKDKGGQIELMDFNRENA